MMATIRRTVPVSLLIKEQWISCQMFQLAFLDQSSFTKGNTYQASYVLSVSAPSQSRALLSSRYSPLHVTLPYAIHIDPSLS